MNGTTSTIAPQEGQLSAPAKTHSAPHDAPQMRCTCGLYSAKSLDFPLYAGTISFLLAQNIASIFH